MPEEAPTTIAFFVPSKGLVAENVILICYFPCKFAGFYHVLLHMILRGGKEKALRGELQGLSVRKGEKEEVVYQSIYDPKFTVCVINSC